MKRSFIISFVSCLMGLVWANSAFAVPSFAAKYDKKCSYCHNAWPQLNAKGRKFKELGYRFRSDMSDDNSILSGGSFREAVSAFIISRPYDKRDNGNRKLRAVQEVEVFIAGPIDSNFSAFMAIEAEDDEDFDFKTGPQVLAYRYSDEINLQASWSQVFNSDPYGFLRNNLRLTRSRTSLIDQRFGGADSGGRGRDKRQNLALTGRIMERLYYNVSYTGKADDTEGDNAKGYAAQVAFDITKDIMIGAFNWSGSDDRVGSGPGGTNLPTGDYSRTGVNFQADIANTRLQGGYILAKDDNETDTNEDENATYSLQALHTFRLKNGKPTWAPMIRYDYYEQNDGNDEYKEVAFNVGYYLKQNVKGFVEFWKQLDTPSGVDEDDRLTVQLQVGF